ncbi:MAG: sortase [Nocardioides sp.]
MAQRVDEGRAVAVMHIPRLGREWQWTAIEGTAPGLIEAGPGHYTGTAWPGERGNAAFAAHRAGHGDPFIDFDKLTSGDEVVLTQGGTRWVYEITQGPRIVLETADWVLDPLPGRNLTLTTCWPRYGSEKRMYVRGELVEVEQQHEADQWTVVAEMAA